MKIYMASSWKNANDVEVIAQVLREHCHEVDCFTDESTGRYVFHYSQIDSFENLDAMNFMKDERSQKAFKEDKKWIDWSDGVLLYLPAGKSAHLEAGYAVGKGKFLIIFQQKFPKGEFDVMYGFADLITDDFKTVLNFLQRKDRDIKADKIFDALAMV
jgi:nucleoside 2-deoxyribosyltransferase